MESIRTKALKQARSAKGERGNGNATSPNGNHETSRRRVAPSSSTNARARHNLDGVDQGESFRKGKEARDSFKYALIRFSNQVLVKVHDILQLYLPFSELSSWTKSVTKDSKKQSKFNQK